FAQAVVEGETAIHNPAQAMVVIRLPLDPESGDGTGPEYARDGGRAARAHQKRVSRKVRGAAHDIAHATEQRAAESSVEVSLLKQLPREDFFHHLAALCVDPVGDADQQLVGVALQIVLVEADEAGI